MFDGAHLIEQVPLQDVDLLQRLNQYFATLDFRLRHGQGWVIFNATDRRALRITQFMQEQLRGADLPLSHYFLSWRDFALTSYLVQVELQQRRDDSDLLSEREREERAIAQRVSRQTLARMVTADLLILNGLVPRHEHEVAYLEQTIDRRYRNRLATILLTPEQPHELAIDVTRLSEDDQRWERLSTRLYETSLVAL